MKNQINTTSAENLVTMLYDGARKFINKSIKALENNNIQEANYNLLRAQDILSELMAGINFEAGDLAQSLYSLYEYIRHLLIQSNLQKEIKPAQEALTMISELREAWVKMLQIPADQCLRLHTP
jgi:flagellar protein FliS